MANRSDRGRPAFVPGADNIGGAHMILADYVSLHKRAASAGPSREITSTKQQQPHTMAQRLSRNRAARRAAVDIQNVEHVNEVYHLNRRIEEMYSTTERRKNPYDPTLFPTFVLRPGHASQLWRPDAHTSLLEPWVSGVGYGSLNIHPGLGPDPRLATRPTSTPITGVNGNIQRRRSGDHYQGWGLTHSLRHVFPADDFPVTRMRQANPKFVSAEKYDLYKAAIMGEVVAARLYKEGPLRELFQAYIRRAPIHDKHVVEAVVADLRVELDVRG